MLRQSRIMSSSELNHLKDIDEKFCQCSVCLERYREPKLLPCLHRYCSDCLKQLIERNQGVTVISCPECRVEVTIPTEGVDGFKTDFYMKNIIEYIQIQESLVDEKLRECYNCSKKLKATAYCFKCNGFLCKECHEIHLTGKSLKDHKQHALSLEDLKSKHMTLEKLSDMKEAPRCQSHLNDFCLLCCGTCNELPICVACVHGIHKNHDINDVKIIAAQKRKTLENEIKNLHKYGKQMQEVDRVKENMTFNFRKRKENFTRRCENDMQNVKREIEKFEEDYKRSQTEVANNKERELRETRKQMDEEMKQIKTKYDNMFDEIEKKSRTELDNFRKDKEAKVGSSKETLVILEKEFRQCMNAFAKEEEVSLAKVEEISQQIVGISGRYENLTTTAHSVLETRNDWTAVHCIPDICRAIKSLIKDMEREFPEVDKLSRVGSCVEMEEDDSPVIIEGVKTDEWKIDNITGVDDGSIVITGHTSSANYQSNITCIKMNGKVLHRKELKNTCTRACRFCACLSEFKIATVCWYNEIGVFDVRDYSYIKKNIHEVISSWPKYGFVWCVTTDPVNNHILVGRRECRDVFVFDDQLNYHHTLTLPEMVEYPLDMAFSEGKLLICPQTGRKAYVFTLEGQEVNVTHELTKPGCDRDDWGPLSVCTDSNGLIYILWKKYSSAAAQECVVTEYTQDGRQLLISKQIDDNGARSIATVRTDMKEKLLVATQKTDKLYIYSLK